MRPELAVEVPIATLGPAATDAACLARRLSQGVILHGTFRAAMARACREDCLALVPCGCMSESESWVDLHFHFSPSLEMVRVASLPTKPMCFSVNAGAARKRVRTVAVYPALRALVERYAPAAEVIACASKPAAVEACATGRADACIGSLDTARAHGLTVVDSFEATMAWGLYARRGLLWERSGRR